MQIRFRILKLEAGMGLATPDPCLVAELKYRPYDMSHYTLWLDSYCMEMFSFPIFA